MANPNTFWSWFAKHEVRFLHLVGASQEAAFDELQQHLHEYCDHLWLKLDGPVGGPKELTISAEGDPEFFGAVRALVEAAPAIHGWRFIAFKPPLGFDFVTDYDGLCLDPKQMWFLPLESKSDAELLGLRISSPTYTEAAHVTFRAGCFIVLECGLGELAAATEIHHVEVGPMPERPVEDGWIELTELAKYIPWRKQHKRHSLSPLAVRLRRAEKNAK